MDPIPFVRECRTKAAGPQTSRMLMRIEPLTCSAEAPDGPLLGNKETTLLLFLCVRRGQGDGGHVGLLLTFVFRSFSLGPHVLFPLSLDPVNLFDGEPCRTNPKEAVHPADIPWLNAE